MIQPKHHKRQVCRGSSPWRSEGELELSAKSGSWCELAKVLFIDIAALIGDIDIRYYRLLAGV